MRYNVAHLTSVHTRYDTRIFVKICRSLARKNYRVFLLVADGLGDDFNSGVEFRDVGKTKSRLGRMIFAPHRLFKEAVVLDAEIYHIHDPELIPLGLKLKRLGKKVIYDSHEDLPMQILGKPYLNAVFKRVLSVLSAWYEGWALGKFDGVISATPHIQKKFTDAGIESITVNNYPVLDELVDDQESVQVKKNQICYVGGISQIRGIREIVLATGISRRVRLQLAGRFSEANFERDCHSMPEWRFVDQLGFLNRSGIRETLGRSFAGLVTLHPVINYVDALPVKMFEYMAAGIPVIASRFPLWREIIEEANCGICVDPLSPAEISEAIDYLMDNPHISQQMGRNGRLAVEKLYNWDVEEKKLLGFYERICSGA